MNPTTIELAERMLKEVSKTILAVDCRYWECNSVPASFFCRNAKINSLVRLFFRLCPINFRKAPPDGEYPIMPQQTVALLQAFTRMGDKKTAELLAERALSLRSPMVKNFALSQGSRICISLYDDSAETPTPLNTAWFAESLLLPEFPWVEEKKKEYLLSIAEFFLRDLGYRSYGEHGIYFYYGYDLHGPVIINASARISSVLLQIGKKYDILEYVEKGSQGIRFVIHQQRPNGSWSYLDDPQRHFTDSFHQIYIMKSLADAKKYFPNDESLSQTITRAADFYRKVFWPEGKNNRLHPRRYDPDYLPHNSWIFQKLDGRDIAEAIVWFGLYESDDAMMDRLISFLYRHFYNRKKKYFYPEKMLWGTSRIPYFEFQGWYLNSLSAFVQKERGDIK